jgi:hypothetical protein
MHDIIINMCNVQGLGCDFMREKSSTTSPKRCIFAHVTNPKLKSSKGKMSMVRGFLPI